MKASPPKPVRKWRKRSDATEPWREQAPDAAALHGISANESSAPIQIVIPCYNEGKRLDIDGFFEFLRANSDVEFIFVDDGSTDNTNDLLEQLCKINFGKCKKIKLNNNCGKAEAVRQGVLVALSTNPKYVGFWDADLATPLRDVMTFYSILEDNSNIDIVMGARVQLLGRDIRRNTYRHYAGRVFATAVSQILGIPVYDTQCGAKMFRASENLVELFRERFVSRWIFDVEILARYLLYHNSNNGGRSESRIYEHPLMHWVDVDGSKINVFSYVRAVSDLVQIFWEYRLGQNAIRPEL